MKTKRKIWILKRIRRRIITGKYRGICEVVVRMAYLYEITIIEFRDISNCLQRELPQGRYKYNWEKYLVKPRIEWLDGQIEKLKNKMLKSLTSRILDTIFAKWKRKGL